VDDLRNPGFVATVAHACKSLPKRSSGGYANRGSKAPADAGSWVGFMLRCRDLAGWIARRLRSSGSRLGAGLTRECYLRPDAALRPIR